MILIWRLGAQLGSIDTLFSFSVHSLTSFRPEQLLLPDDPNFLPELTLDVDLDLANLNFDTDPSSQSASVLSPRSRRSSRTSHSEMPELQVPSSTGHGYGLGLGDFAMGDVGTDARGSLHGYGMK